MPASTVISTHGGLLGNYLFLPYWYSRKVPGMLFSTLSVNDVLIWTIVSAMTFSLSSCTTSQPESHESVHSDLRFSRIAMTSKESLVDLGSTRAHPGRSSETATKGAALGTASGVVVGAASCGPWFPICVLMYGSIGLVAGSVVGISTYQFSGVSDLDALHFGESLSHLNSKKNFQNELISLTRGQLPAEFVTSPERADAQVVTDLCQIRFEQKSSLEIHLSATAELTIVMNAGRPNQYSETRKFSTTSDHGNPDRWLATDAVDLGQVIDSVIKDLSSQMAAEIQAIRTANH